jgi:hypothetical protein
MRFTQMDCGIKVISLVILVGTIAGADRPLAVSNLVGPSTHYESIVGRIPSAEFVDEASKLLSPGNIGLGVLVAYEGQQDLRIAGPGGSYECSLKTRRVDLEAYKRRSSGCPVVQQAIKIGTGILYRSVDSACGITTRLMQGQDPLVFVANGQTVTILDVSFSSGLGAEHNHWLTAHVFAKSGGAASRNTAYAVVKYLTEVTGVDRMFVSLRQDPYFSNDCSFPTWPPFERRFSLPAGEMSGGGTFVCLAQGLGKIGCDGH